MKKGQELPNTIIEFVKYTMLLNNVIKNTGLIDGTPSKMVNFHYQMATTPEDTGVIRTIIELGEDNILLNNMTKFYKVLIKTIQLRERALGVTHWQTYVQTDGQV